LVQQLRPDFRDVQLLRLNTLSPNHDNRTALIKMTRAPSDVYARQLFPKKYGIPLFIPEPYNILPSDYRDQGASIGDVGTVASDGSFQFAFNICTPSDNAVNYNGVPEGFEQVSLLPGEISHVNNMFPPGSDVSSASVRKVGLNAGGASNLANG
jgi:hypothetical protein